MTERLRIGDLPANRTEARLLGKCLAFGDRGRRKIGSHQRRRRHRQPDQARDESAATTGHFNDPLSLKVALWVETREDQPMPGRIRIAIDIVATMPLVRPALWSQTALLSPAAARSSTASRSGRWRAIVKLLDICRAPSLSAA